MLDNHSNADGQLFSALDLWEDPLSTSLLGKRQRLSFGQWQRRRRLVRKLEAAFKARNL